MTTMDSVFAFKDFELKDCVLEMTSAKYHVRIELLDVWKNTRIFEVMNRIMKLDDRISP